MPDQGSCILWSPSEAGAFPRLVISLKASGPKCKSLMTKLFTS